MDPLNQKLLIQNSNSFTMEPIPSSSQQMVKRNLFTKDAKSLTTQWIPTTTKTLIAGGIIPLSYLTYQYLTKSAPPKVTVAPFSLIEPITMVVKALFSVGVIALGTNVLITQSNVRSNENPKGKSLALNQEEKSNFTLIQNEYTHEEENELLQTISSSSKGSNTYQNAQNLLRTRVINMLENNQMDRAVGLAKNIIAHNPNAASPIIPLIAENHLEEVYPLIEPVLIKNHMLDNKFLVNAMRDVMKSLDSYIERFFSNENNETNEISLEQILNIIEPYIVNNHSFAYNFYYEFITDYPLSGWKFASRCINNETPVANKITEEATGNFFTEQKEKASYVAAAIFAIKWIQQVFLNDEDYSSNIDLQDLYENLCDKTKLEKIVNDHRQHNQADSFQKIAAKMIKRALAAHTRYDLLIRINEKTMDPSEESDSDLMLDQNDPSTKTITS